MESGLKEYFSQGTRTNKHHRILLTVRPCVKPTKQLLVDMESRLKVYYKARKHEQTNIHHRILLIVRPCVEKRSSGVGHDPLKVCLEPGAESMQDPRLHDAKLKGSCYFLEVSDLDRADVQLQQFSLCCQAVITAQCETVVGLLEKLFKG